MINKKNKNNSICSRCILDTTVPEITFDAGGVCNYCKLTEILEEEYPPGNKGKVLLRELIKNIKKSGKNKQYDCVVGVSGGTDSSYSLYQAVKLRLRPLAVHFDNGWNSEVAVGNIKKICARLKVDLETYVVDWEEFKDLQRSFLKASVSDAEIPTDVGILGILFKVAKKEGIKYIINGHSFRTEGIAPVGWTYMDGRYIASVQKRFGTMRLKTFPNFMLKDFIYYSFINPVKVIPFLNYFPEYSKQDAQKFLNQELGWVYYGGHHHESIYTRFFQSYYLPKKFNIDKRKRELSARIRAGLIPRKKALQEITGNSYEYEDEIVEYVLSKLGISKYDFGRILKHNNKSFRDYPTYFPLMKILKVPLKIAYDLGIIPKLLFLKFSSIL